MLQYISDDYGRRTAVIIPIQDWNKITQKHKDLLDLTPETKTSSAKNKLSEIVAGSISPETADAMLAEVKQMREEWERDIC